MILIASASVGTGCTPSGMDAKTALVFAASSLSAPFEKLAREFEAKHPKHRIRLHFAGTSRLALQIREGAPADLFAAADLINLERAIDDGYGHTQASFFASNSMAVATLRGNPHSIRTLHDLSRSDLRVALCGPQVPAGRYARQVLSKAGCTLRSISDEPNVNALLSKLKLNELDAAIMYATDVRNAGEEISSFAIPPEWNVTAKYPMAVLNTGRAPESAQLFADFILSDRGQSILHSYGFTSP